MGEPGVGWVWVSQENGVVMGEPGGWGVCVNVYTVGDKVKRGRLESGVPARGGLDRGLDRG